MVKFNKKTQAITLLEIIISIAIISMLMIMLFSVIAKKAKAVAEKTSGTFYCFKDSEGKLNQIVELSDGTVQEITNISSCNFSFPGEATDFITYVIGGGGGGGKISETFSGYTLGTTKSYEYNPFQATTQQCAKNPTIMVDGVKSAMTTTQYMCDSEVYECKQGNTNVRAENTDTTIKKIFDNSAYEIVALKNRVLFVKGGDNSDNESGALCIFRIDIPYGTSIQYFFDGRNEYICSSGVEKKVISASSGKFKTSDIEVTAQGKTFPGDIFMNENIANAVNCSASNSTMLTKKTTSINRQNDKLEYIIINPVLEYGTGGKAGNHIVNTSIKFSGKNIIIPKNNIGDGGKAGESGQPTIFEEYNIKAQGGSAGTTQKVNYELNIDSGDGKTIIKGADLVTEGAVLHSLSPTRKQAKFIDNILNDGDVSDYANEKVLPTVIVSKQKEYMGIGAKCDADGCTDATSAKSESFGSGGGGGNTRVLFDPFYKLTYTRPNYLKDNEYEYVIDSIITPTIDVKDGSAGMGGAIVITWQ